MISVGSRRVIQVLKAISNTALIVNLPIIVLNIRINVSNACLTVVMSKILTWVGTMSIIRCNTCLTVERGKPPTLSKNGYTKTLGWQFATC